MTTEFLVGDDAAAICREIVSDRFIAQAVDGSRAKCIAAQRAAIESAAGTDPEAEVGAIEVDGDRATAEWEAMGLSGALELARAGESWEVDAVSGDTYRAPLETAIQTAAFGDTLASFRPIGDCLSKAVEDAPDPQLRQAGYDIQFGGDAGAERAIFDLLDNCASEVNAYVTLKVLEIYEGAGAGASEVRCAKRRLPFVLKVSGLDRLTLENQAGTKIEQSVSESELAGIVQGLQAECG